MGVPFSPPRAGQEMEVGFPLRPLSAPVVLFQKLLTSGESLSVTGDDAVVRLPFSGEANSAFRGQRPPNTVPLGGEELISSRFRLSVVMGVRTIGHEAIQQLTDLCIIFG